MNYKKNYKDYLENILLTGNLILWIQYIFFYYVYKESQVESLKRSLIFSIGFIIISIILSKPLATDFRVKDLRYKKSNLTLLILFIILNIINTI